MPDCPRCHQSIPAQAVICPHCQLTLKAYGHPGVPLHRATGKDYLCQTCTYDDDDTCTFPQRPYARECTLYRDRAKSLSSASQSLTNSRNSSTSIAMRGWFRRNAVWIALIGLGIISLLLSLM